MKSATFIFLLFFTNISFAKVTLEKLDEYDKFNRQYAILYISESIEKGDAELFEKALKQIKDDGLHLKKTEFANFIPEDKNLFNFFL